MSPALSVATIVARTEAEGPGHRYALWVQGCPMRCPGCCNPELLQFEGGTLRTVDEIFGEVMASDVEGISLLGGEPFAAAEALATLAHAVRRQGRSVMVFTGYTLAELQGEGAPPGADALLAETDLLVDGRYDKATHTTRRRWIGSDNQVLHFLTERYHPDDPRFSEPNTLEIRIDGDRVLINGFPIQGARTRI